MPQSTVIIDGYTDSNRQEGGERETISRPRRVRARFSRETGAPQRRVDDRQRLRRGETDRDE
jgi:hypothetical protein